MKKADELMLYTPEPKHPPLDARLCVSVAAGEGKGRYIKDKTLTVAVWDNCKAPLVVWRFCGDYWTGSLRREKQPVRRQLFPDQIEVLNGRQLAYTEGVAATQEESELLQDYFNDRRPGYLMGIVRRALDAASRKKREARNAMQEQETQRMFAGLPELPQDLEKRILACCSDSVFLWITNTKERHIVPGGVRETILVQHVCCDSCGAEYSVLGRELKHKGMAVCKCCGNEMQVYNTQYPSFRVWRARTFLLSQPDDGAVWVRRMVVHFSFTHHKAKLDIYPGDIWWTDGQASKHWKKDYVGAYERKYVMCQSADISKGMTASQGPYQPRVFAAWEPCFETDLRNIMKSDWIRKHDKNCNFYWEVKFWEATRRYPMAESLIKTGWSDALGSYLDGTDGGTCNHQYINLSSKTYYGVFGLTRQELALVQGKKKKDTFAKVNEAAGWKKAGLQITAQNLRMVSELSTYRVQSVFADYGVSRSLKYLRHQTRRVTGKYDGIISARVASEWIDYLDMAQKAGMNLDIEQVRYPLDLKRRHDEMIQVRHKIERTNSLKNVARYIEREAAELESKYSIEQVMRKIKKTYEYDGEKYIIRVPAGARDILEESRFLDHCVQRGTRYFERIATRESYIFFLRQKADPNTPWYTLEVEPGGTIRQKRSYNNEQYADLEDAKPFLAEWQQAVRQRMSAAEVSLAEKSRAARVREFDELKEKGSVIRTGSHAGQLLVEELMRDLMEVEQSAG